MEMLKAAASKAVGTKAVLRALNAGQAACVFVASDIDTFLYQKVTRVEQGAGQGLRSEDRLRCRGGAQVKVSPSRCQIVSEGCGIFWI